MIEKRNMIKLINKNINFRELYPKFIINKKSSNIEIIKKFLNLFKQVLKNFNFKKNIPR